MPSSVGTHTSRISIAANRDSVGALFGLAIITFLTRTYIRTRILKQFYTEDVLLSLAVVCLCATTGLAYASMQKQYEALAAILHDAGMNVLFDLMDSLPMTSKLQNAASTLWWTVIYPVKLAFLFFFRRLIIRSRTLYRWWWCAFVATVIAFMVSVTAAWLTCPYFTVQGVLSCSGPSSNYRVIRDTAITTAMDIFSDGVVLSFPVAVLWQIPINKNQKFGVGVWLCLSIVMVLVAIVRIAGIKLANGEVDIVWLAFWQQQEASISVIMVSMSAFRSLFVENVGAPRPLKYSAGHWRKKLVRRGIGSKHELYDKQRSMELPQIPNATLSGVSEAIRGV